MTMKRTFEEQKQHTTMNEAIPLLYTTEQYERALKRASSHPDRSQDPQSLTRGKGLITGLLGEVIVEDFLRDQIALTDDDERKGKDKLNFDIVLKDGTTLEVKSKGQSPSTLPNFYDCSVSAINPRQKADFYVFVRIQGRKFTGTYGFDHSNCRKAWICGYISKDEMIDPQRLMKRGTVVRNSSYFDFKAKSNCYQIKIRDLLALSKDFGKFIDLCAGKITWVSEKMPKFCTTDKNYFFCHGKGDNWKTGYFEGLDMLDNKDRKHFEDHKEVYVFYHAMKQDKTKLQEEKRHGWQLKEFVLKK